MRTLRNAVERDKVHHAYLFVGSRGTGKTSMAKILAACLNCDEGPTIEPCGRCESCVSIARASSLDVIEMDAASNNSVDDIRELRESVAYAPVSGRRKVYILDEAHMLSTAAWNAFLKTLEEPPPNTVFVLATTEAGKVPPTVVDRCHRFDFQRPTVEQIGTVLRRVADAESIEIPPEALAAIARSATGSFRDALGTLEQLVTYSGSEIALEDVLAVLGVADGRLPRARPIDAVARGDAPGALRALEQRAQQGRDPASLARDLEARARELLLVQTLGEVPPELSLTAEADQALREQAARVGHDQVVRLLELLGEAMEGIRAGADARTRLELALVKAARPELDGSLRALLARIERLEQGRRRRAPRRPRRGGARPRPPARRSTGPGPRPRSPPSRALIEPGRATPPQPHRSAGRRRAEPPPAAAAARRPPHEAARRRTPRGARTAASPGGRGRSPATSTRWLELWPAVVELVRGENAMLGAVIEDARPVALEGEDLTLAFASTAQFLNKKAEDPANRAIVGEALRSLAPGRWRLSYELREVPGGEGADGAEELAEEELVRRFIEEFDAEEVPADWLPDEPGRPAGPRRAGRRREGGVMPKQPRMPNVQQMMAQVQKMQQDMEVAQEELRQNEVVEASAGRRHGAREGERRPAGEGGADRPRRRSTPRTSRSSATWCSRRSTRRCARPRSWPSARWAVPPRGSTSAASAGWACRVCERRLLRAARPAAGDRALQAPRGRAPHRAAAGLPHPARLRRGRRRAGRGDHRGQGEDRPLRGLLQPHRRAPLPDLRGHAPRPRR